MFIPIFLPCLSPSIPSLFVLQSLDVCISHWGYHHPSIQPSIYPFIIHSYIHPLMEHLLNSYCILSNVLGPVDRDKIKLAFS